MSDKKTCTGKCGQEKPLSEFYAKSTRCKRCTLDRQKELKAEKAKGTTPKVAKRKGGGSTGKTARKRVVATAPPPAPVLHSPAGFGFSAQLEGKDIQLSQYNASAEADQVIWLSPGEAATLQAWLGEQLGQQ